MKRIVYLTLVAVFLIILCSCKSITIHIGPAETEAPTETPYVKSQEEKNEDIYQEAKERMEKCDFYGAKSKFEQIKSYKDSAQYIEECQILYWAKLNYPLAIKHLKGQLKNPASLQIHGVKFHEPTSSWMSEEQKKKYVGITIDYSAQNGFGGMERTTFYDALHSSEDNYWTKLQDVPYWYYLKKIDVSSISY